MLWTNKLLCLSLEGIFSLALCLKVRARTFSKSAVLESVGYLETNTTAYLSAILVTKKKADTIDFIIFSITEAATK